MVFGNKTFTDSIYITGDVVVEGLVNGLNLSFFDDVLYTHGNQTITADKTIHTNNIIFHKLIVNGTVDGKRIPDDVVPLNHTQPITIVTKLQFVTIKVNVLTIVFALVENLVDGVNLENLVNDSLTFEGPQFVNGTKNLTAGLTIDENSNLNIDGLLNGINISAVVEDAVLLYEDQVIGGNKTFHNSVTFYRLNFTGKSIDYAH